MIGADDILVTRRAGYQIAQAAQAIPAAFSSILVVPLDIFVDGSQCHVGNTSQ